MAAAFKDSRQDSEHVLETMTSVLNAGMMPKNPVGNQIRSLQSQLDAERKDKAMLLLAMETKAPEVFAEYMRLKDEEAQRLEAQQRAAQMAQQQQMAQNSRFSGGGSSFNNRGRNF